MKKISTVTTKASRKISGQKLTIGLDLGDRDSWYCVLDKAGQIELEQRVRTSAKRLEEAFGAMPVLWMHNTNLSSCTFACVSCPTVIAP